MINFEDEYISMHMTKIVFDCHFSVIVSAYDKPV